MVPYTANTEVRRPDKGQLKALSCLYQLGNVGRGAAMVQSMTE